MPKPAPGQSPVEHCSINMVLLKVTYLGGDGVPPQDFALENFELHEATGRSLREQLSQKVRQPPGTFLDLLPRLFTLPDASWMQYPSNGAPLALLQAWKSANEASLAFHVFSLRS